METGLEGREVTFDEVAFSDKDREQTAIPLEGGEDNATDQQLETKSGKPKYKGTPSGSAVREDSSEVRGGQSKQAGSRDRSERGQAKAKASVEQHLAAKKGR